MLCAWRRTSILLRIAGRRYNSTAVLTSEPVILRPYQEQCLDACMDALRAGHTRLGVSLPTGAGKTTVFISLLSRLAPPAENEKATRSLIVVNSIELARQSAAQVARLFPNWTVEIEQGGKYIASGYADVTVATYQTLSKENRLLKFDPAALKAVIVDEAHHAAAKSYRALLSRFHQDIKHPNPDAIQETAHKVPIIGFSATFGRHDGLALGSVFERIVYHRDFLEMIKEEWLCDVRFTTVRAQLNLQNVTISGKNGDFNPTSLAQVVNTDTMNDVVVKAWIDRASNRRSTLVFCVNIDHVKALTQTFRKYGIDARYIFSETPPVQRQALVADFKTGLFPVLVNCAILTEGADIPNIDCVLVARPTRSRNIFAQMIGRGMRLSPHTGKEDCRIIDFVDSNGRVNGVVSVPTLFGLDPFSLECEDETPQSLDIRMKEAEEAELPVIGLGNASSIPEPKSILYTDHDDPFSILQVNSKSVHVNELSPYTWVACGGGVYVIELLKQGFVRIDRNSEMERYESYFTPPSWADPSTKASPYLNSRFVTAGPDLEQVIKGTDHYIENRIFKTVSTSGLRRTAKWRSAAASDAQKKMIEKRWVKSPPEMSTEEQRAYLAVLKKGDAATVITRMKHGSQGRLKKQIKVMKKAAEAISKEEQRRSREEVKVGLLA
ncbi:P-loop containing nucleoside triphosphate hydrolase protein [Crepidotus variabilis]|uniref:P-loop containing nucleoside triphosphate hydrolase protein n=1 Tax=Crepidotus variabilis TaxID=179855 RepID=A0A9P6ESN6_9AGAR|nr:P-loop containing nucleoside triphosphate hydrolase protein [Crepidotus variabilis]